MQNGNLTILDPIWTTAYVTRNHGYMIYDTLFAIDENNAVKPQMVDKYEVSRRQDGVDLHACATGWSGTTASPSPPRTASPRIKRWGKRDSMGQKLMDFVEEYKAVDAKTFQIDAEGAVRPGARFARQAVARTCPS